jgi:hypothetical protein
MLLWGAGRGFRLGRGQGEKRVQAEFDSRNKLSTKQTPGAGPEDGEAHHTGVIEPDSPTSIPFERENSSGKATAAERRRRDTAAKLSAEKGLTHWARKLSAMHIALYFGM